MILYNWHDTRRPTHHVGVIFVKLSLLSVLFYYAGGAVWSMSIPWSLLSLCVKQHWAVCEKLFMATTWSETPARESNSYF